MSDRGALQAVRDVLAERVEPIVCAYVFGSVARGSARRGSDIDIAILFAGPTPRGPWGDTAPDLVSSLEGATRRPVDLIDLGQAPPDLVHRVLRDGVLVAERDRSRRIRFEVRARGLYLDLLPCLRRMRRPSGPMRRGQGEASA